MHLTWAETRDLQEIRRFVNLGGMLNESKDASMIERAAFVSCRSECFTDWLNLPYLHLSNHCLPPFGCENERG